MKTTFSATEWDSPAGEKTSVRVQKQRLVEIEDETARIEAERKLGRPYTPDANSWPDAQGWAPAPDRPIAGHWSKVPCSFEIINGDPDSLIAANNKLRRLGLVNTKVRLLKLINVRGSKGQLLERGSVIELSPVEYAMAIGSTAYEPVPPNTPLKEISRFFMPSSLDKARRIAAAESGKDPLALTISDIWKHFAKRKAAPRSYITDIAEVEK
jgi:hypothetical protein